MKSLKRILFFLVIIVAICILIYIISQNLLKSKSNIKAKSFEELVQFKTNSINDNAKVDSILENLELSKYITKVEKKSADEKLIIYYNCNSEKDVKNYWTNVEKISVIEKNSVILFSLITNLNIISYNFSGINPGIISNYPYVNGNNREKIIECTREEINNKYNQDVRNFNSNPKDFLKYNIDINFTEVTLYEVNHLNNNVKTKEVTITNKEQVERIKTIINDQNFGILDYPTDGMCSLLLDLNNGYVIGLYDGNTTQGFIFKGTVEELLSNKEKYSLNTVSKTIPIELKQYIQDIAENN